MATANPTVLVASTAVNTAAAATTTTSINPATYEAVFVFALVTSGAAFTDTATMSGNGLTWTKVAGIVTGNDYGVLFVGYGTPSGSGTGTLTFSRTPTAGRYVIISQTEGQDGTNNPVAASGNTNGSATSGSITLTRSGLGQRQLGFWGHKTAEGTTPDSTTLTWTELSDTTTTYGIETQYVDGYDQTHTASWVTSSTYVGFAVQLKPFAYTCVKKSDTPAKAYAYTGQLLDEDEAAWAIL